MGNIFSNKNFTNRFFNAPEMGGPLKATDPNDPNKEQLTSSTSTKEGNWQTGTNTTRTNTFSSTSEGSGGGGSSSTGEKKASNPEWSAFLKTSKGQAYTANRASSNSNTTNRTETLSYSTKGVSASSAAPTAPILTSPPPKPPSGTTGPPPEKTKKYRTPIGLKLKRFVKKVTDNYTLNPFPKRGKSSNKRVGSNAGCRNCR